jgi:hypothetical protein
MVLLFSVWCSIVRLSMVWGFRMSQSLILIDALSSACWEKKKIKKREVAGAYFLGLEARHTLLAVPGRIFIAVKCN